MKVVEGAIVWQSEAKKAILDHLIQANLQHKALVILKFLMEVSTLIFQRIIFKCI